MTWPVNQFLDVSSIHLQNFVQIMVSGGVDLHNFLHNRLKDVDGAVEFVELVRDEGIFAHELTELSRLEIEQLLFDADVKTIESVWLCLRELERMFNKVSASLYTCLCALFRIVCSFRFSALFL